MYACPMYISIYVNKQHRTEASKFNLNGYKQFTQTTKVIPPDFWNHWVPLVNSSIIVPVIQKPHYVLSQHSTCQSSITTMMMYPIVLIRRYSIGSSLSYSMICFLCFHFILYKIVCSKIIHINGRLIKLCSDSLICKRIPIHILLQI